MDRPAFATPDAAVRAALAIACEAGTWDAVRLQDVAQRAGMDLAGLLHVFPDRDALAQACFDAADEAMLSASADAAWAALDVRERLRRTIATWLDALPPAAIVRGMVAYKLQPEHVHLQVAGVMRISRTVQALREVALLRATGLRREAEEAALTTIYMTTFLSWLFDASPGAQRTRARLARALDLAHRVGGWSG